MNADMVAGNAGNAGNEHVKPVRLLSKDSFFKKGFEYLVKDLKGHHLNSIIILDDGVRFLYFIDITEHQEHKSNYNEKEIFLECLKHCVNRNLPPDELIYLLNRFLNGRYNHVSLSFNQRRVLRCLIYGLPQEVAMKTFGVKYKNWHNCKDSGLKRLGIKNTLCYLRAAHEWNYYSLKFD
ncbi:hypothetical protein [Lelliottia nimipressuralis]